MPSARPRNRAPNCDWHTSCKISGDPNHRGEPIGSKEIDLVAQNSRRPCRLRSEEHTSELQSLMRISYAVFCLKKKTTQDKTTKQNTVLHNEKKTVKIE